MVPVRRATAAFGITLLLAVGVARIVATYGTFSQVWDEPAHIATGLEWLQRGEFRMEPLHPPLARVAVALGPYLAGARLLGRPVVSTISRDSMFAEGNAVLEYQGAYARNLRLARFGILPFFILACLLTWRWTAILFGEEAALASVLLFSTLPLVLAHAGLATTDIAITATLTGALWSLSAWLTRPSPGRSLLAGAAIGAALISKLSSVVFLPGGLLGMLLLRRLLPPPKADPSAPIRPRLPQLTLLLWLAAAVVVWAGYRFSMGSIGEVDPRFPERLALLAGKGGTIERGAVALAGWHMLPAPAFFHGIKDMLFMTSTGRKSYFFGQVYPVGTWLYFPVAALVKTPIPFLVLGTLGIAAAIRRARSEQRWEALAPLVASGMVLLGALPAKINIGARHILPMFPLLAIYAGLGAVALWRGPGHRLARRFAVVVLCAWQVAAGIQVHPDYLAYFNEPASLSAQPILLDTDLDWGQDVLRLADTLRALPVDTIHIAYHGSAVLERRGLPPVARLHPYQPVSGWIAISLVKLKLGDGSAPRSDQYAWLERYRPYARVGRSILLYHIE